MTGAAMRGSDTTTGSLFSYVDLEHRVPARHPLRLIRAVVNEALATLDAEFARLYAAGGRPSIAPEKLLRGSLLQAFFSIRSERQLMEQLDYNLLFRWFIGVGLDDAVWDHSTYSKNRDRLLEADVARKVLKAILAHPKVAPLLSDEHFSVDGTLVQAWASLKSFQAKASEPTGGADAPPPIAGRSGAPEPDGEAAAGQEAREQHEGKTEVADDGHGLVVESTLTEAAGTPERAAAKDMIESHSPGSERSLTVGADKPYDTADFVTELRHMCVTPHVAQNTTGRCSAIDARTTRHAGYAVSQRKRKLIEEAFGWAKTIGGLARMKLRGTRRMGFAFTLAMAAYNLIRLPKLIGTATA